MKVRLEVVSERTNIERIRIEDNAIIGRGKECNLRIKSAQASRKHCRITIDEEAVLVTDLGSANGTFLDGQRLPPDEPTAVQSGQELMIGHARFVIRISRSSRSVPRPVLRGGTCAVQPQTKPDDLQSVTDTLHDAELQALPGAAVDAAAIETDDAIEARDWASFQRPSDADQQPAVEAE